MAAIETTVVLQNFKTKYTDTLCNSLRCSSSTSSCVASSVCYKRRKQSSDQPLHSSLLKQLYEEDKENFQGLLLHIAVR